MIGIGIHAGINTTPRFVLRLSPNGGVRLAHLRQDPKRCLGIG